MTQRDGLTPPDGRPTGPVVGWAARLALGLVLGALSVSCARPGGEPPRTPLVVARSQIEPYTVVTPDMIGPGPSIPESRASEMGAIRASDALGMMAIRPIAAGEPLTAHNVRSLADIELISGPLLEVVSFRAFSETGLEASIAPKVWVDVHALCGLPGPDVSSRLVARRLWVTESGTPPGPSVARSSRGLDLGPQDPLPPRGGPVWLMVAATPVQAMEVIYTLQECPWAWVTQSDADW